ncbi:hypothetical protein [Sphingobacterium sp. HMA12]|uniref:hypothetical protein n=1 Tax=Sphingobacterium sp. HMA12 TaxID=2050894 RepID=UPI000CEA2338|nr:hypothetical protein [Sphingobacterium sp. HMA12]
MKKILKSSNRNSNLLKIVSLASFLCLSSCTKNEKFESTKTIEESTSTGKTKATAITNPNEQNANKNWKWDDPTVTNVKLYFKPKVNNQPSPSIERPLPWFTFGNPMNNSDKDYRSELGWELYLKDFGTPDRPAQTPFFALYNRYSGILRFFVYNYRTQDLNEGSKTYYVGKLSYTDPDKHNGTLSFLAPPEQFVVDKEDKNTSIISITKKSASDIWMNFDFLLAKPAVANSMPSENVKLNLSIFGANETELNLGSDFSNITAKSVIGGAGTTSDFSKFINGGVEYTTSGGALLESINKLQGIVNPKVQSKADVSTNNLEASRSRAALPVATVAAAVSVVKGLFGFVKSFVGGSKSGGNTQSSLQYNGIVNTTGTAILSNNLYNIQFGLDYSAPISPSYYIPLYEYPIGILRALPPISDNYGTGIYFEENEFYCGKPSPLGTLKQATWAIKRNALENIYRDFTSEYRGLEPYVRLDSINLTLLNRKYFNDGLPNSFLYFPSGGVGEPRIYDALNEYTFQDSKNSGWRNYYPFTQLGQDYFYVKKWYYPNYIYADYIFNDGSLTQKNKPSLGIYIKFTITDPKYPNNESRERVIFKVVDLYRTTKQNLNIKGCPVTDYN